MPVQIAEVRATGYIPQALKKSGYTMMAGKDLAAFRSTRNISSQKEEFSQKPQADGQILRKWQRKDNAEHSWPRKDTINE